MLGRKPCQEEDLEAKDRSGSLDSYARLTIQVPNSSSNEQPLSFHGISEASDEVVSDTISFCFARLGESGIRFDNSTCLGGQSLEGTHLVVVLTMRLPPESNQTGRHEQCMWPRTVHVHN